MVEKLESSACSALINTSEVDQVPFAGTTRKRSKDCHTSQFTRKLHLATDETKKDGTFSPGHNAEARLDHIFAKIRKPIVGIEVPALHVSKLL